MIFKQKVQPIGIQRNGRTDILLENYIGSYIQKLLFPSTLLQYFIFPKYSIRHNFINTNDLATIIKWGFYTIFTTVLNVTYVLVPFLNNLIKQIYVNMNWSLLFIYTLYIICSVLNAIIVVLHGEINVELVVDLQIIQKNLKTFKGDWVAVITNWIHSVLIVGFYVTYAFINAHLVEIPSYFTLTLCCILIFSLDLNIIYIIEVVTLLRKQITSWISDLEYVIEFDERAFNEDDYEEMCKTLWQSLVKAYITINDAYSICEKITGNPIIMYVCATFFQFLTNVQMIVSLSGITNIHLLLLLWTMKNSILLTVVCWRCEKVHLSLRDAKIAILLHLRREDETGADVGARQFLRRAMKEECRPFSARGLFAVNSILPLQVLSIIATYTVVILQFNFL